MLRSVKEDKRACDANKININVERGRRTWGWLGKWFPGAQYPRDVGEEVSNDDAWLGLYVCSSSTGSATPVSAQS